MFGAFGVSHGRTRAAAPRVLGLDSPDLRLLLLAGKYPAGVVWYLKMALGGSTRWVPFFEARLVCMVFKEHQKPNHIFWGSLKNKHK